MEEDKDLSLFDKSVMELFDLCREILKKNESRGLKISSRGNPFLSRLEKYIKTYTKTEPKEHVGYFEKIYNDNKRFILLGPQRDTWLIDSKPEIVISYGEECGLKTEMKLHLTAIYFTACRLRDEIKEETEGLPNSSDNVETEYPSRLLLFLYRIFSEIVESENEKTKLRNHIETLEKTTGVHSSRPSGNDPLAGFFDMAANMAEQVSGAKIPRDKMPAQKDFGKMMADMVNDPKIKSTIGSVMQNFQNVDGAGGIGGIVTKLVETLGSTASSTSTNTEAAASVVNPPQTNAIENGSVNDEFSDYEK